MNTKNTGTISEL